MANFYYDFFADRAFTPYVGAGAGIAFINSRFGSLTDSNDTEFAYQAIIGAGYKVSPNVRVNLDGRYYGTLNPGLQRRLLLARGHGPGLGLASRAHIPTTTSRSSRARDDTFGACADNRPNAKRAGNRRPFLVSKRATTRAPPAP